MRRLELPSYYLSHGGGPWPWLTGSMRAAHDQLAASLAAMPEQLGTAPRAVLMVSAHWEEPEFTVMAHPDPPMLYDYSGFPAHTYQIQYPAPGAPALADEVHGLLRAAGIAARLDPERGFDHGTYAPMAVIYPAAKVPTLQLSLRRGLDPQEHLAAGRALAALRTAGVLIVGSGLSYHNLGAMGPEAREPSAAFDAWLSETLVDSPPDARTRALGAWETAPAARFAHPREEHLLPLMVAVGAAETEPAERVYHQDDFFGHATVSSFRFGGGRVRLTS